MPVVYLVDDEPVCLDAMRTFLSIKGYECRCYSSAEALLDDNETVEQGVVLADFRLNGMNGLQLFEKMRSMGGTAPCVLISGHADADLVERSLELGVSAFLQKPTEFGELESTIARCFQSEVPKSA